MSGTSVSFFAVCSHLSGSQSQDTKQRSGWTLHNVKGKADGSMCKIGQRISVKGEIGTVKYYGTLEHGYGELWLGVEWDDPTRGKHDGVFKGKRIFEAAGPKSASFVRPKVVDQPRTFLEALRGKYQSEDDNEVGLAAMYLPRSGKVMETVGFGRMKEKFSHLDRLDFADLSHCRVASVDESQAIQETCKELKDLNLAFNLISSWADVEALCQSLPSLRSLNLFSNRMRKADCVVSICNLQSLTLGACRIPWLNVVSLLHHLPNLTHLSIECNDYVDIAPSDLQHERLVNINLGGNGISDWQSIENILNAFSK